MLYFAAIKSAILCQAHLWCECFTLQRPADLLNGANGDSSSTGHNQVTVFNVWADLIQHKWDDVWLHSQKQNITLLHSLFVAGGEVHSHFLQTQTSYIKTQYYEELAYTHRWFYNRAHNMCIDYLYVHVSSCLNVEDYNRRLYIVSLLMSHDVG